MPGPRRAGRSRDHEPCVQPKSATRALHAAAVGTMSLTCGRSGNTSLVCGRGRRREPSARRPGTRESRPGAAGDGRRQNGRRVDSSRTARPSRRCSTATLRPRGASPEEPAPPTMRLSRPKTDRTRSNPSAAHGTGQSLGTDRGRSTGCRGAQRGTNARHQSEDAKEPIQGVTEGDRPSQETADRSGARPEATAPAQDHQPVQARPKATAPASDRVPAQQYGQGAVQGSCSGARPRVVNSSST